MILSHKHKFIFIKVGKTASSSMEIELSKFCGPKDVITPVGGGDKFRSGFKDQNWKVNKEIVFTKHMPARNIKPRMENWSNYCDFPLEKNAWDNYFKFCFERNPWDKVISFWFYYSNKHMKTKLSLSKFIQSGKIEVLKRHGYGLYVIDGKIAVDKIFLYEELDQALVELCNILKLPGPLNLPRAKVNHRTDKRSYRELLDGMSRDRIANVFKEEIKLFGYTF